ncbi:MAG: CARDB domain-containing protein [Methanobacteriota archaeon]
MKKAWSLTFLFLLLSALGISVVSTTNMTDRLDYPEYWLEQGVVQYSLKNYDRALTLIDNALKQDPNAPSAWMWRGKVLKELGRIAEAAESDAKAIELDPLINDPYRKKVGNLADSTITPLLAARPANTDSKLDQMIESDVDVGKKPDPTGPDMTIYDLQATLPEGSDRVEITASIGNEGVKPTRNFFISFFGSYTTPVSSNDSPIGFYLVPNLLPGTKQTISGFFPISQIPSGEYYIGAYLDPNNEIMEINENNNGKTAAVKINIPEVNPSVGPQLGNVQLAVPKSSETEQITVKRADLEIDKITGPVSAIPGEAIAITTTVRNAGDADAGPFRLTMYLSRDTKVSSDDVTLGFGDVPDLIAGKAREGTATAMIPASVTPGTYYLVALADSQSQVTEKDKQNNSKAQDTPIIIKAEDAGISSSSSTLSGGTSEITTIPSVASEPEITVATPEVISDPSISPESNGTVLPIATSPLEPITIPSESSSSGLADLVIDSLSGPSTAVPGDVISVTTKVRNAGSADAGSFRLSIYLSRDQDVSSDDINLGYGDVPNLTTGKSREGVASVTVPQDTPPETYYLVAMADSLGKIHESDETNNNRTQDTPIIIKDTDVAIDSDLISSPALEEPIAPTAAYEPNISVTVDPTPTSTPSPSSISDEPLPDLVPVNLSSDPTGKAGSLMNVSTSVMNIGTSDSRPFMVSLYLSPDTTIREDEDLLIGDGQIDALPAGKQVSGDGTAPIPTTMKPGTYYFGLIVDSKKEVNETDEENNYGHSLIPIIIQT